MTKQVAKYESHAPMKSMGNFKALMSRADIASDLAAIAGQAMTPEKIMKVALIAITKNPKILECTQESVLASIRDGIQYGLDFSGFQREGYLVPYGKTCQFIPGYGGLLKLARQSGEISSIYAANVFEGDEFEFSLGTEPVLKHKPSLTARREWSTLLCAYLVVHFKDDNSRPFIDVMPKCDIEKRRSRAMSQKGPWGTWELEMSIKTVIRHGLKQCPFSTESGMKVAKVVHHEEVIEAEYQKNTSPPENERVKFGFGNAEMEPERTYEPEHSLDNKPPSKEHGDDPAALTPEELEMFEAEKAKEKEGKS